MRAQALEVPMIEARGLDQALATGKATHTIRVGGVDAALFDLAQIPQPAPPM